MSMEALRLRCLVIALLPAFCGVVEAATYQTVNFSVTARDPKVAEQVGKSAEVYRRQLAIFWLGKALPNWSRPCKVNVTEGVLGAGGQTTFQFTRGEVLNWRMDVQGTLERILDSVLPHEINHTIFACHFRRPLPRWADEGAATLFEHRSEQLKQLRLLNEVIRNKRELISLRDLLSMKEYPKGERPMLTLYAQGYALADFLVQQKGRRIYLKFISDGERNGWEAAIKANFDHEGIESLEKNWRGWVLAGMPKLTLPSDQMLAAKEDETSTRSQATARPEIVVNQPMLPQPSRKRSAKPEGVVRSQSPDPVVSADVQGSAPSYTEELLSREPSPLTGRGKLSGLEPAQPFPKSRARIEAPVPRIRDASLQMRDSAIQTKPATEQTTSWSANGSVDSDSMAGSRPTDLLFGDSKPPGDMEQTRLVQSNIPDQGPQVSNRASEAFEFSGVLLPGERKVNSGSTPQWAGFPGQKKSF